MFEVFSQLYATLEWSGGADRILEELSLLVVALEKDLQSSEIDKFRSCEISLALTVPVAALSLGVIMRSITRARVLRGRSFSKLLVWGSGFDNLSLIRLPIHFKIILFQASSTSTLTGSFLKALSMMAGLMQWDGWTVFELDGVVLIFTRVRFVSSVKAVRQ